LNHGILKTRIEDFISQSAAVELVSLAFLKLQASSSKAAPAKIFESWVAAVHTDST
jgi:hypothetical protein